jgi:hypothetical protein
MDLTVKLRMKSRIIMESDYPPGVPWPSDSEMERYFDFFRQQISIQVIFFLYDPREKLQEFAITRILEAIELSPEILRMCGYSDRTIQEIACVSFGGRMTV